MKTCPQCKKIKPLIDFKSFALGKDETQSCRHCLSRGDRWRKTNPIKSTECNRCRKPTKPEDFSVFGGKRTQRCLPCYALYKERTRQKRVAREKLNPKPMLTEREKQELNWKRTQKIPYKLLGLDLADYEKLVQGQEGKCMICSEIPERLYIDHCHTKNIYRGLLCHKCNAGIGFFRDNPELCINAARYLNNSLL